MNYHVIPIPITIQIPRNPSNEEPTESDSQNEPIPRPDQEPKEITPTNSQNEMTNNPDERDPDAGPEETHELTYLVCQEEANALTETDAHGNAKSVSVNLPTENQQQNLSEQEAWTLLATTS